MTVFLSPLQVCEKPPSFCLLDSDDDLQRIVFADSTDGLAGFRRGTLTTQMHWIKLMVRRREVAFDRIAGDRRERWLFSKN